MLPILIVVSLAALVLARLRPAWDDVLACVVALTVAATAGFSEGFDHENYVEAISGIRTLASDDWAGRLFLAKDPLFLMLVELGGLVSDGPTAVFCLVAAFSVGLKLAATSGLRGSRTLALSFYAIFLAPGLEFAAIRAGLALGFLLLAFNWRGRGRWAWLLLSLMAHASVLLPVLASAWQRHRKAIIALCLVAVPVAVPLATGSVLEADRIAIYLEDRGSIFALLFPTLSLGVALLVHRASRALREPVPPLLQPPVRVAVWVCIVSGLLLTPMFVTVGGRIVELGWCLMVFQLAAFGGARLARGAVLPLQTAWLMLTLLMIVVDLKRDVWAVLL